MRTFRILFKSRGFALISITTLAVGIGANAAIFSVAEAVLFRDLPYREPDRLVVTLFGGENPASPADYFDWKAQNSVFEDMSAAEFWTPNLTGRDQPEQLWAVRVSDNLFEMLGVSAALGRTFTAAEEAPDGAPLVVLSHGLWMRRFGGSPGVIDQVLTLDGRAYRILGVMPREFGFPLFWATRAELWAPLPLGNRRASLAQSLRVFARLKPEVSMEEARTEMDVLTKRIADNRPSTRTQEALQVLSLHQKVTGNVRSSLIFLLVTAGFVLLIACANVANLLLARANERHREMAVRSALGATRRNLFTQLIAESLMLAVTGGVLGMLLGFGGLQMLRSQFPADVLPRQEMIAVDGRILTFVMALSVATTLIFGLLPAIHASRSDINEALKNSARLAGSRQTQWRRRVLAMAEISIALSLLVGAGLMLRSLMRLQSMDPGFTTRDVLTMTVSVAGTNQSSDQKRIAFWHSLVERTSALPGIDSVSLINHLPLAGDIWVSPFTVEGQTIARPEDQPSAAYRVTYPGYFRTMRIALRGRDFNGRDNASADPVVIVNEGMARRYFPGEDPIGKRIRFGGANSPFSWMSIVGVIPSVKQSGWTDRIGSEVYVPLLQSLEYLSNTAPHFSYMTLIAHGNADIAGLTKAIRAIVAELEPNSPVSSVATMEEVVREKLSRPRTATLLASMCAVVGLILAAIGVYGVISYSVSMRTQEIGLRTALGAKPLDVLRLVLREGAALAAGGIAAGLVLSFIAGRLLKTLLFEISSSDPLTLASGIVAMLTVALLACYIPARRALRVDPIVSLRNE